MEDFKQQNKEKRVELGNEQEKAELLNKTKQTLEKANSFLQTTKDKINFGIEEAKRAKNIIGKKKYAFQYFKDGEVINDERYAKNESELAADLAREGIYGVVNIEEKRTGNKILDFFDELQEGSLKPSLSELYAFAQSMSMLTRNGMDLVSSLRETSETIGSKPFKKCIESIADKINSGLRKGSEAFAEYPDVFDKTFIAVIKTCDRAGDYGDAFKEIAEQIKIKTRLASIKNKAMVGPIITLGTFFLVSGVMLLVVFPKMKGIFGNQKLPAITEFFMGVSTNLSENGFLYLLGIGFVIVFFKGLSSNPSVRSTIDKILLSTPVIEDVIKNKNMYTFANTFDILGSSGFDSKTCLDSVKESTVNTEYLKKIDEMIDNSQLGLSQTPIAKVMKSDPTLWRTKTSNLIVLTGAGEKSGQIYQPLKKEKVAFLNEYENSVLKFIGVVKGVVFTNLVVLVLVLVLAIFLPIIYFDPTNSGNSGMETVEGGSALNSGN